MSFNMILELNAKPESADDLAKWMEDNIADTKAFKGCQHVEVFTNGEDKAHFLLYEKWDTPEDQASYMAWRTESGAMEILGGWLAGPPSVTPLNRVVAG